MKNILYVTGISEWDALSKSARFTEIEGALAFGIPENEKLYEIVITANEIKIPEGTKRYKGIKLGLTK